MSDPSPAPPAPRRRLTRRRFLGLLAATGLAGAGGVLHARKFEPGWFDVERVTVRGATAGGAPPLRILHLSDLHASRHVPLSMIAEAVDLGLAEKPDVIALTGDYVTGRYTGWEAYAQVLAPLRAAAPTFAVLGNHDGGVWSRRHPRAIATSEKVRAMLGRVGIELLHNRTIDHQLGNEVIRITGVGDLWSGECQPLMAFPEAATESGPAPRLRLVLNHNPDAKDLFNDYPWDLMLCGHTHGGQFKLPLIGTPFAPVQDKRYVSGLHRWDGRQIYITRGVGNLHGVRFNCRPEITLLEVV